MKERQNIDRPYTPEAENKKSALMEISQDLIICPHCKRGVSHPKIIYAKGKGSSTPMFWCKSCRKKFGVRGKSINWQVHFGRLYSIYFTKSNEKSAIRARYNDFVARANQRLFDSRLRLYRQTSTSPENIVEKAFVDTIKELQLKAQQRLRRDNRDNWDTVINHFDSEKSYELDFKLLMAENSGMVFSKKQDPVNPLIHCHKCGAGSNIIRYGFSPVGRRRFYCKDCEISFVLRAVHLFSVSYVKEKIMILMLRSLSIDIEKLPELSRLCGTMAMKFMSENNMARISKKLQTEFTIQELFRINEIEVYIEKQFKKYTFVRTKPEETLKKMTIPAQSPLLPKPDDPVEINLQKEFQYHYCGSDGKP